MVIHSKKPDDASPLSTAATATRTDDTTRSSPSSTAAKDAQRLADAAPTSTSASASAEPRGHGSGSVSFARAAVGEPAPKFAERADAEQRGADFSSESPKEHGAHVAAGAAMAARAGASGEVIRDQAMMPEQKKEQRQQQQRQQQSLQQRQKENDDDNSDNSDSSNNDRDNIRSNEEKAIPLAREPAPYASSSASEQPEVPLALNDCAKHEAARQPQQQSQQQLQQPAATEPLARARDAARAPMTAQPQRKDSVMASTDLARPLNPSMEKEALPRAEPTATAGGSANPSSTFGGQILASHRLGDSTAQNKANCANGECEPEKPAENEGILSIAQQELKEGPREGESKLQHAGHVAIGAAIAAKDSLASAVSSIKSAVASAIGASPEGSTPTETEKLNLSEDRPLLSPESQREVERAADVAAARTFGQPAIEP